MIKQLRDQLPKEPLAAAKASGRFCSPEPHFSLFPQHTRTPEPERCFLCSSYSEWEDMARQKFRPSASLAGTSPESTRHSLCLVVVVVTVDDDPSPGPHPNALSGLSGHRHCGIWDALYWTRGCPSLALRGLGPGAQTPSLRRPSSQGCLDRGHRRLVSEPKKRLCLLDLESSARRCCSSWGWGTEKDRSQHQHRSLPSFRLGPSIEH